MGFRQGFVSGSSGLAVTHIQFIQAAQADRKNRPYRATVAIDPITRRNTYMYSVHTAHTKCPNRPTTRSYRAAGAVDLPPPPLGHTRKPRNSLALSSKRKKVGTRCRSSSYERFLEGCSSPFMRLAEHLTALRAWYKQCLSGW